MAGEGEGEGQGAPVEGEGSGENEGSGERPDPWADSETARREIERLRREAARYRTERKELEPLARRARELEDQSKTETQRLTEQLQASDRRAGESAAAALRYEVALEQGLTAVQARRLVGTTKEELEADARELLESFGQREPVRRRPAERLTGGGAPEGGGDGLSEDMNTLIRRRMGQNV